jgi:hypothetical protein
MKDAGIAARSQQLSRVSAKAQPGDLLFFYYTGMVTNPTMNERLILLPTMR